MFGQHLNEVRDLMEIKRYQNKFKHKVRTVAEHSWFVAKVAHGLASWEKYKFGNRDINIEMVLFLAINHDIVEAYTGDIVSTTKRLSTILEKELAKVERIIFKENILTTIPESWGDEYMQCYYAMSNLDTEESQIVKYADLIDRMFECMEEIRLGNTEKFSDIIVRDIRKLYDLSLENEHLAPLYFLKYALSDIGADKFIPVDVQEGLEELDFSKYF